MSVCSRLNSSSVLCDCQLPSLTQWLRRTGFHATVDARCRYPESLAGMSILDVQPQDLSCGTQHSAHTADGSVVFLLTTFCNVWRMRGKIIRKFCAVQQFYTLMCTQTHIWVAGMCPWGLASTSRPTWVQICVALASKMPGLGLGFEHLVLEHLIY